jgi:UDP-N-acetylglucosamine diphosphorylase/glucosamine-1-phosphate N-acetyltransferase
MAKRLYIFEDDKFDQFYPLTYNRPIYELICGINRIKDKIASFFPEAEINLLCRDYLEEVLQAKANRSDSSTGSLSRAKSRDKLTTSQKVNDFKIKNEDEILLINGRVIPNMDLSEKLNFSQEERFFFCGDDFVCWTGRGLSFKNYENIFKTLYVKDRIKPIKQKSGISQVEVNLIGYLWDLVNLNKSEIENDFERTKPNLDFKNIFKRNQVDDQTLIYDIEKVYIGKDCRIDGQVVLDARGGPIFVEDKVTIQPQTRVEGPCYIGKGSIMVGGKIRAGTSIGPVCRIGGEVEQSIFLGYSNKYHEGFLGHSYVGEWVNLGALTTNSDLKNNYSPVKVMVKGELVDSGLTKVGSFLGDHVKVGIGTLLGTGMVIGFTTNIFGGGMIREKSIPPFCWGDTFKLKEYELDKAINTAQIVMGRRNVKLGQEGKDLFKKIFEMTKEERKGM